MVKGAVGNDIHKNPQGGRTINDYEYTCIYLTFVAVCIHVLRRSY